MPRVVLDLAMAVLLLIGCVLIATGVAKTGRFVRFLRSGNDQRTPSSIISALFQTVSLGRSVIGARGRAGV